MKILNFFAGLKPIVQKFLLGFLFLVLIILVYQVGKYSYSRGRIKEKKVMQKNFQEMKVRKGPKRTKENMWKPIK
jgi:hypothetical protein